MSYIDILPQELQDEITDINRRYYADVIITAWKKHRVEVVEMLAVLEELRLSRWMTNRNVELIADDSDEGIEQYNMYKNMYENAHEYLKANKLFCKYHPHNIFDLYQ